MKKSQNLSILLVLLLLPMGNLSAQCSFKLDAKTSTFIDNAVMECIYQYTVNAPLNQYYKEKEGECKERVIYQTILQANNSVSKFLDWHTFKKDSIIYTYPKQLSIDSIDSLNMRYYFVPTNLFLPVIVKNFPNGKLTATDEIAANEYIYNEDKTTPEWELKDDTLTVCNYLCNKAICSLGGRKWTVWYTPEITISDGPWKLSGLPGLILKAEDDSGTHLFEATTIRQSDRPIYCHKNNQLIKMKKKEFIISKNKYEKNPMEYLVASRAKSTVIGGNMLVNGKRTCWLRKTDYCPLELW